MLKRSRPAQAVNGFISFVKRALSSTRSYAALLTTALTSITSFAISIAIARSGSINDVAEFAIGFAGYILVTGITRAMVAEPAAARLLGVDELRREGSSVAFYGVLFGIPLLIAGWLLEQPFLMVVGLCSHGIAVADFAKYVPMVFGRPMSAVVQESLRVGLIFIALAIPEVRADPLLLFTLWLATNAVVGYVSAWSIGISVVPLVCKSKTPLAESASYGLDYLLGSGASQMATFMLGGLASPSVNAAIRGTGTLFGPISLITTSVRALTIPYISRGISRSQLLSPSIYLSIALFVCAFPLLLVVNIIPGDIGQALLGDTWLIAKDVLLILSAETVLSMLSNIPFSGHRSMGAYGRTLAIRSVLAPFRVFIVVLSGVVGGHVLVAAAMLFTSGVSMAVWWVSYYNLVRRSRNAHR